MIIKETHIVNELVVYQRVVEEIKLNIKDPYSQWKGHICQSVNDPHMTTFDKTRYEMHKKGEFILYRHTNMSYAIHAVYQPCNKARPGGVSCNCGVLVRAGDDVISIDKCGFSTDGVATPGSPFKVQIYKNGEMTPNFIIKKQPGSTYTIYLPSGTYVVVKNSFSMFVNLFITSSEEDFRKVEGLCGDYDHNKNNDLTAVGNSEQWRFVNNFCSLNSITFYKFVN